MNLLEKLTAIDKSKIIRDDLKEQLEGVIFEYDEQVQDSIDNAQTVYDILLELYPDILPEEISGIKKIEKAEKKEVKVKKKPVKKENLDKYLDKDEKPFSWDTKMDYDEKDAEAILDNMQVSSYAPLQSTEYTRKDGTKFIRKYLDDYEAKMAFLADDPLYAIYSHGHRDELKGKVYPISSVPELVQSFKDGLNHFIANDENIIEVKENKQAKEKKEASNEDKEQSKADDKNATEKKKITKENKAECDNIVAEIKSVLQKYKDKKPKKDKKPARKKTLANIVKDSLVIIIKRVISKEKVKKEIDVEKFESVKQKGKDFLKALRKASGGISDDNDQMINSFEKDLSEILKSIKDKQAA